MKDQILHELWAIKDGLAKECGHDLRQLFDRLKAAEKDFSRPVVNRTSFPKQAVFTR